MNAPLLSTLGLSEEALAARVRSIGGSDANTIMSGDEEKILALWETKTGRRQPEDLSDVLPVVMGSFTEPLNTAWFQKQTGLVVVGEQTALIHPTDDWRTATLDGLVAVKGGEVDAIFEAKHVGSFWKDDALLAKYQPQLHHNMAVADLRRAHLSILKGNADWLHFVVDYDEAYGAAVRQAELEFWYAIQADEPPVPYRAPDAPKPAAYREVDMTGHNEWAAYAADLLACREAAAKHDTAKDELKKLVLPDVARASGHGVEFKRDKKGALRLSVLGS